MHLLFKLDLLLSLYVQLAFHHMSSIDCNVILCVTNVDIFILRIFIMTRDAPLGKPMKGKDSFTCCGDCVTNGNNNKRNVTIVFILI